MLSNQVFRKSIFVTLLSSVFFSLSATAGGVPQRSPASQRNDFYDELYDSNGQVRAAYRDVLPIYEGMDEQARDHFVETSKKDFREDYGIDALPRMLTEKEYDELSRGVVQRGLALRKFLSDYYSGNWSEIEKVIPRNVLERIVTRKHEGPFEGLVPPDSISFPYGPDIIRDKSGNWRVIEDNIGFIGGPGDLKKAREILLRRIPEYRKRIRAIESPDKFYDQLVERYHSLSNPPGGKVIMYMVPPHSDNEDARLRKLFAARGVETITPYTQKRLVVGENGVFVREKLPNGQEEFTRVGYIVLNEEHADVDNEHDAIAERSLVEEAQLQLAQPELSPDARERIEKALVPDPKTGKVDIYPLMDAVFTSNAKPAWFDRENKAHGLLDAILTGKVASNYSPGVDFIDDKEFYVYVDDLIRHYLKQEPILKNIPTERFASPGPDGEPKVNEELVDRVFKNKNNYVIKAVDGRGGNAVWVGPKLSRKEFESVRAKIFANPEKFIVQTYTPLSVMDGKIVDLRMISAVDPKGVFVSGTPWGRALPMEGDGKVNISSSGRELAVIVTKDRAPPEAGKCLIRNLASELNASHQ